MKEHEDYRPLEVEIRPGESVERAIKKFSRKVKKDGILNDFKHHQSYEKPSVARRRKKERRKKIARKITRQQNEKNESY